MGRVPDFRSDGHGGASLILFRAVVFSIFVGASGVVGMDPSQRELVLFLVLADNVLADERARDGVDDHDQPVKRV